MRKTCENQRRPKKTATKQKKKYMLLNIDGLNSRILMVFQQRRFSTRKCNEKYRFKCVSDLKYCILWCFLKGRTKACLTHIHGAPAALHFQRENVTKTRKWPADISGKPIIHAQEWCFSSFSEKPIIHAQEWCFSTNGVLSQLRVHIDLK